MKPTTREWVKYAVEVRYPGRDSTPAETRMLLSATTRIRTMIRESLGLR